MRRLSKLLAMSAVALLLAGAAACGGGDDDDGAATDAPTASRTEATGDGASPAGGGDVVAYFEAVDDIATPLYEHLATIANGIDGATFDSAQEEIDANRDALQSFGGELETAAVALGDLDPPAEAEEEHQDFIDALAHYAGLSATVFGLLEDAETTDDLDSVMEDHQSDTAAAFQDYDDACRNIEDRGEDVIDGYDIYCPVDDQE